MALDIRELTTKISVSPQIDTTDVQTLAQQGFTMVINNRPDGEEEGQPLCHDIKTEAEKEGLAFVEIPIDRTGIHPHQIEAMQKAMHDDDHKILAYCRTGTRSTNLWAMASASSTAPEQIIEAGKKAGYDLQALHPYLKEKFKN